jgi:hypothetical protein
MPETSMDGQGKPQLPFQRDMLSVAAPDCWLLVA